MPPSFQWIWFGRSKRFTSWKIQKIQNMCIVGISQKTPVGIILYENTTVVFSRGSFNGEIFHPSKSVFGSHEVKVSIASFQWIPWGVLGIYRGYHGDVYREYNGDV